MSDVECVIITIIFFLILYIIDYMRVKSKEKMNKKNNKKKGQTKLWIFVVELENELKELERVRKIMIENPIFIQEEITVIENRIKHIKDILSVLKD